MPYILGLVGTPPPHRPKCRFFSLHPKFHFFSLSVRLIVEFWWCFFKVRALPKYTFGLSGPSCATLVGPSRLGRRNSHTITQRTPHVRFGGHRHSKHGKTVRKFVPSPSGPPPPPSALLGPTLLGPHFFWVLWRVQWARRASSRPEWENRGQPQEPASIARTEGKQRRNPKQASSASTNKPMTMFPLCHGAVRRKQTSAGRGSNVKAACAVTNGASCGTHQRR